MGESEHMLGDMTSNKEMLATLVAFGMFSLCIWGVIFLALSSVSFAGLSLDRVDSDFGHGCQYFTYTNDLITAKSVAAPTAEVAVKDGGIFKADDVKASGWEILTPVNATRWLWDVKACHDKEIECDDKNLSNGFECIDGKATVKVCGEAIAENFTAFEYLPFKSNKSLASGKTQVRYCADYSMKPTSNGWSFEADIIPTFDGVRYPQYTWFNASWAKCLQINITGNFSANYTHRVALNTTTFNYSNALANLSDIRFLEGNCSAPNSTAGALDMWIQDVNTTGTSNLMFQAVNENITTIAMYYNNTAAPSISNATTVALFGDDFAYGTNLTTSPSSWYNIYNNGITITPTISGGELIYNTSVANDDSYWIWGPSNYNASMAESIQIISRFRSANSTPNGFNIGIGFFKGTTKYTTFFMQKWLSANPNLIGKREENINGVYNENDLDATDVDTTFREYIFTWNTTASNFSINGVNKGTKVVNVSGFPLATRVQIRAANINADARYDYFFVMKYQFPAPVYAYGAEEFSSTGSVSLIQPSPTNTTYPYSVPFSVNCSGTDASYLLNISIDGAVNISNQAVSNASVFSTNITHLVGFHNTSATCANTTSNTSATIFYTVQDAPTITLYTPLNNTANLSGAIPFGYSATSAEATLSCSIYLNGTLNQTNASYAEGTIGQFLISGFQNGTYPWAVRCYDSLGSYGDSETRTFIVAYDSGGGGTAEGQASEFVAAAITMIGILWFFAFLMHQAKVWLWKTVWMMACFLTAYIAIAMMSKGFNNLLSYTDLSDLSFSAMAILMWCVVILFGWLLLSIMYRGAKALMDAANGKKGDDLGLGGEE